MIIARDISDYHRTIERLLDLKIGIARYVTYIVTTLVKGEKSTAPVNLASLG